MTSSSRATTSRAAQLARLGFADAARADRLLDDPALAGLFDPLRRRFGDGVVDALGAVADPDLALLGLVRLMEALRRLDDDGSTACASSSPPCATAAPARTGCWPSSGPPSPSATTWSATPSTGPRSPPRRAVRPASRRDDLVAAVGPQRRGERTAYDALRVAYRRELLGIAALDLTGDRAVDECPRRRRAGRPGLRRAGGGPRHRP